MRRSYTASILLAGILAATVGQASAATVTDYAGSYGLYYTDVSSTLNVEVILSDGTVYPIPVSFSLELVDEQIPYSAADAAVDEVMATIAEYAPGLPSNVTSKIDSKLTSAFYKIVDQINAQAAALPDVMNMTVISTRTNTISGDFADEDGLADQFSLSGTLAPDTGDFNLFDVYVGQIDASGNYCGHGVWGVNDVDVTQTVKTATVHVTGSVNIGSDLCRV